MAYTKQTWTNGRGGSTPITAQRMNYIETGIYNAANVADATSASLAAIGETAQNNTHLIDALDDRCDQIQASMAAVAGEAQLQADLFVNDAAWNCSGTWTHGPSMAERPGFTNAGNFSIVSVATSAGSGDALECTNNGLYLFTMAFRGTTSTSGKRAYMDLYRYETGPSLVLVQRSPGYDSNTFSGSYLWPMTSGTKAMWGFLSVDTIAVPNGVNGVNNNTDVGLAIGIMRICDI